jgi:hypothetical protein
MKAMVKYSADLDRVVLDIGTAAPKNGRVFLPLAFAKQLLDELPEAIRRAEEQQNFDERIAERTNL